MMPIWPSGPSRRCPTWASSCSATLWCWRGAACSTHLSRWPTAAHTPSWRPWLCPVWPSGRSHTPAVSLHTPIEEINRWRIQNGSQISAGETNSLCVAADVSHAFVLEGPRRSWVCATARGEEREHFLSVLRSAIDAALAGHQWRWLKKRFGRCCLAFIMLKNKTAAQGIWLYFCGQCL